MRRPPALPGAEMRALALTMAHYAQEYRAYYDETGETDAYSISLNLDDAEYALARAADYFGPYQTAPWDREETA